MGLTKESTPTCRDIILFIVTNIKIHSDINIKISIIIICHNIFCNVDFFSNIFIFLSVIHIV